MSKERLEQFNNKFSEEDAEKITKAALGKDELGRDAFERPDKEKLFPKGLEFLPDAEISPIAGDGGVKKEPQLIKLSWLEDKEETAPVSEKFSFLEEKRNIYIEAYQNYLQKTPKWRSAVRQVFGKEYKEGEISRKLKKLKFDYDEAKYAYCKDLIESKKTDMEKEGKSGEESEKELAAYKFTELYSKIFLEEKELLQKAEIEGWPPKEKGIFRRGLDLWMRQGKYTRLLISTSLLTGISIATGGLAAGGIGAVTLFAGSRYAKGLASAFIAQDIGKGVDWAFSKILISKVKKELEETEEKSKEEFSKSELTLDGIKAIEANRQQASEKLAKLERIKILTKAGAMVGAGVGASLGLNWLENAYAGSLKSAAQTGMPPEDYEKFKSYEDVSAKHNIDALKESAEIRAEAILEDQRIENLAIIKQGEGAWHAVYRQLENQLDENPAKFGLKSEDLNSAAKFKFLTQETNKILVDNGYISPDGSEIRIAKPGVKVILEADNKIKPINEGLTYEWTKPKAESVLAPRSEAPEVIYEEPAAPKDGNTTAIDEFIKNQNPKAEFFVNEPESLTPWPTKTIQNMEFEVKGIFQYTPKGEISDLTIIGKTPSLWESKALLNDNWRKVIMEKGFSSGSVHANVIENRAGEIIRVNKILKTLENMNMSESREADYLNIKIKGIKDSTEAIYGDVFK